MKKKVLYIILCLFSMFSFNSVRAESGRENNSVNKIDSKTFNIVINLQNRIRKTGYFYNQSIGGKKALCLDMGKHSGKVYSSIAGEITYTMKKAYKYLESQNSDQAYIISQIAVWVEAETGSGYTTDTFQKSFKPAVAQALCQYYNGSDNSSCNLNAPGYNSWLVRSETVIYNFMHNTSGFENLELKIYSSGSTNEQRLLAPPISSTPPTSKKTCPDGTMEKEITECVQNYPSKNPTITESDALLLCQAELCNKDNTCKGGTLITTGSPATCSNKSSNSGQYQETVDVSKCGTAIPGKGENELQINNYCNLYCIEDYAQQSFPGNVRPSVSVGTYLIWPTSPNTITSKFKNSNPLYFTGKKTCYVVMAGSDSTVNTVEISDSYNALASEVDKNNKTGSIAGRTYDNIRLNGGCESIYSGNNGFCTKRTNTYNNYINSETYKNAVNRQNEINTCISNAQKTYAVGTCVVSGGTQAACEETLNNKIKECGALSSNEESTIKKASELQNAVNACNNEKQACNNYVTAFNNLIEFSNQMKTCALYTPSCSGSSCDIYNYETNVDISWSDPEYGTTITDSQLEKAKNYVMKVEGGSTPTTINSNSSIYNIKRSISQLISNVKTITNQRKITAEVRVQYSLPTSEENLLYNYVVKRNDSFKAQTSKPSNDSNYTTIGFSNLPISYNAPTNVTYELRLSNIKFGDNGGQYKPSDYVCNYNVTKTLPTDCLCPPGTKYTGKDLSDIMIDEKLTCSEAQEQYCDTDKNACPDGSHSEDMMKCMETKDYFTCYDKYCRTDKNKTKYCPNDPTVNISACLNNFDYDYCIKTLCDGGSGGDDGDDDGGKKYKCKNTNGVDGEMDITSCVQVKMAQGLTESEAISACDALVCPLSGLRIIYRTISLENPFPSKLADADTTNIPVDLKIGMFNDDVRGRYPGTNWNDQKLVQNHILTVKRTTGTVDGSDIYNTEPLYKFELNTTTINKIREYNKQRVENGGYADFTLECRINNAKACVSENFVHNQDLSGIVGGVCMNATNKNDFYKCSGDA